MLTFQWEEYLAQVIALCELPTSIIDTLEAQGIKVSGCNNFISHSRNFVISKEHHYYVVNGIKCRGESLVKLILDNTNLERFRYERERMSSYILSLI